MRNKIYQQYKEQDNLGMIQYLAKEQLSETIQNFQPRYNKSAIIERLCFDIERDKRDNGQ